MMKFRLHSDMIMWKVTGDDINIPDNAPQEFKEFRDEVKIITDREKIHQFELKSRSAGILKERGYTEPKFLIDISGRVCRAFADSYICTHRGKAGGSYRDLADAIVVTKQDYFFINLRDRMRCTQFGNLEMYSFDKSTPEKWYFGVSLELLHNGATYDFGWDVGNNSVLEIADGKFTCTTTTTTVAGDESDEVYELKDTVKELGYEARDTAVGKIEVKVLKDAVSNNTLVLDAETKSVLRVKTGFIRRFCYVTGHSVRGFLNTARCKGLLSGLDFQDCNDELIQKQYPSFKVLEMVTDKHQRVLIPNEKEFDGISRVMSSNIRTLNPAAFSVFGISRKSDILPLRKLRDYPETRLLKDDTGYVIELTAPSGIKTLLSGGQDPGFLLFNDDITLFIPAAKSLSMCFDEFVSTNPRVQFYRRRNPNFSEFQIDYQMQLRINKATEKRQMAEEAVAEEREALAREFEKQVKEDRGI